MAGVVQPNGIDDLSFYRSQWFPDGGAPRPSSWRRGGSDSREDGEPAPAPDPRRGAGGDPRRHRKRAYGISFLPSLTDAAAARTNADDVRLALYDQVLGAWKQLVDVRFKLLGLLPAVSIVALATIASGYR